MSKPVGTIRVRFKHGDLVGDPVIFTRHGAQNGYPRMRNGGDEIDIPADELDDKEPFKIYRHKDGKEEMMTEKQYRQKLWDTGGYRNSHLEEAAPPGRTSNVSLVLPPRKMDQKQTLEFLTKQKEATLLYRNFNPIVMELISDLPGKPGKPEESQGSDNNKLPDITKLKPKDAVEYIKSITNEELLGTLSIAEDRGEGRPIVISAIESKLKSLRGV